MVAGKGSKLLHDDMFDAPCILAISNTKLKDVSTHNDINIKLTVKLQD